MDKADKLSPTIKRYRGPEEGRERSKSPVPQRLNQLLEP